MGEGVRLYEGNPKTLAGAGAAEPVWTRIRNQVKIKWQTVRDALDANRVLVELILILVTGALAIVEFLRLAGVFVKVDSAVSTVIPTSII